MKYWGTWLGAFVLLPVFLFSCGGGSGGGTDGNSEPSKPLMGMLQLRVRHNLQDEDCLARGDCFYSIEEDNQTAAWLARIAADSDLAVLHWDRAIPWLAFDADPPPGTGRAEFFDARIDAGLRSWINAFADHFASLPYRYLAVTPLHGLRDRLERCRIDEALEVETTDACPDVGPGTVIQFQYDDGTGPVSASFDLERSYRNLVLYLYDKLRPDYFAVMIEVNLYKKLCPAKWSGLVNLYRTIYNKENLSFMCRFIGRIMTRSDSGRCARGSCRKTFITLTIFFPAWVFTMITARSKSPSPKSGRRRCPETEKGFSDRGRCRLDP
jgi:hypothetical protein